MNDQFLIALSVSIYRLMLFAYPEEFRQEYGGDMLQVFRDCCLRKYRQNGSLGVSVLWAVTLLDLVKSAFEEHLQKETKIMNKNTLIRLSGWALVLAGIGFFTIFLGFYIDDNNPLMHFDKSFYYAFAYVYGFMVSPILLGIGLFGLQARYGRTLGNAAKSILFFGALLGPALALLGNINPGTYDFWWFTIIGFSLSMVCLAVFGVIAVQQKPLPRGNGLPILSGVIFPATLVYSYSLNEMYDFPIIVLVLLTIQFLSMAILGVILQGDVEYQQEALMAAAD